MSAGMSGYKSVLSCFMKKQFLRCTDEEICHLDHSETSSHVELKQNVTWDQHCKDLQLHYWKFFKDTLHLQKSSESDCPSTNLKMLNPGVAFVDTYQHWPQFQKNYQPSSLQIFIKIWMPSGDSCH